MERWKVVSDRSSNHAIAFCPGNFTLSATFPRGKRHQYRQTHDVLRSAFDWSGEHLHSYLIHGQKEIVATPQVRGPS